MTNEATASTGLQWKWVVIGTLIGVIICFGLYQMMSFTFHTSTVPTVISLMGFVIMGIVIGYKSPGYTIKEPAIGGLLTIVLLVPGLEYFVGNKPTTSELTIVPIIGLLLGLLGGWVGEQIQSPKDGAKEIKGGFSWGWVFAGTIIAFILNNLFVFGFFALMKFGLDGILASLALSFIIAGFLIGYLSPGVTIKEAAAAGLFSVILNFLLLYFGFSEILRIRYMLIGVAGGFLLALVGGWLGEKLQAALEKTALESVEE